MSNNHLLSLILLLSILFNSCAQLAPLHSARTEGKGNFTFAPTLDGTGRADFNAYPSIRAELAFGLTDKFDIIGSVYSGASIKTSLKYQIYGDNLSNFIVAAMPGYEYAGNFDFRNRGISIHRLHLPLIININTNGNFDFFIGPNLIFEFDSREQNLGTPYLTYPGLHGGIEIGRKRIKYSIGGSLYLPYVYNFGFLGSTLNQFGISARIPIFR